MGLGRAIATCCGKYAAFSGRASRPEYWFWMLFEFVLIILRANRGWTRERCLRQRLVTDRLIDAFLPTLAVTVRRLHDSDRSGWWSCSKFVPIIGQTVLIVLMCLRGTDGANRFEIGPAGAAIAEMFA